MNQHTQILTVNVDIDKTKRTITINQNFDNDSIQAYVHLAKALNERLGAEVVNYKIIFENETFDNVMDLASACIKRSDAKLEEIQNVTLDSDKLKALKIKSIDFDKKVVEFTDKADNSHALAVVTAIPTLLGLKIKVDHKTYRDILELVNELIYKGVPNCVLIDTTNRFMGLLEFND